MTEEQHKWVKETDKQIENGDYFILAQDDSSGNFHFKINYLKSKGYLPHGDIKVRIRSNGWVVNTLLFFMSPSKYIDTKEKI